MKKIGQILTVMVALCCLSACETIPDVHCFCQCGFDSHEEIESSFGASKVDLLADSEFVEGIDGRALRVKKGTLPLRVEFFHNLPESCGKIEYWARLENPGRNMPSQFLPLDITGWHVMNRITTNTGAGSCGWQCSIAGYHLYQFGGVGVHSLSEVFGPLDPTAWHHYETRWNIDGLSSDPEKVVSFRIDGMEVLSATKATLDRERFGKHLRSSRVLGIGGDTHSSCRSSVDFLIDNLKIWDVE